jgi:diaminopimelate epimerase
MKFTKMHGCGNDYVYVNGFVEKIEEDKKPELVRRLSDRHFGIGGDGVIFINPGKTAEFEMEMYNADGTRAQMCGNGIRCVAKYVYDKGLTDKTSITIESFGKVKYIDLTLGNDGKVETARVNMGAPILNSKEIPVISENDKVIDEEIIVKGKSYRMTCVSMGNPHAVVFVDDIDDMKNFDIDAVGTYFENHERFPERTNTEFVRVIDRNNVQMRVWERGTGETLACGTGCCATAVACVLNGR